MKTNKIDKLDLSVNPITGFPTEGKRYLYPKAEEEPNTDGDKIDRENRETTGTDEARIAMLLERLRWRGARKIRGYRFKGTIPEPKHATDYMPWLKED